jgi:hypothetical protein
LEIESNVLSGKKLTGSLIYFKKEKEERISEEERKRKRKKERKKWYILTKVLNAD